MDAELTRIESTTAPRSTFNPSKLLYIVGYDLGEDSVRDYLQNVSDDFRELFRLALQPGRIYTVGRKSKDSKPDIEIDDPSLYTSRVAATIYAPSRLERMEERRDYILFTHLGKNPPSEINLNEQSQPKGLLSSTARIILGNESKFRMKDITKRRTVEIYPGESITYSNVSLELLASNE